MKASSPLCYACGQPSKYVSIVPGWPPRFSCSNPEHWGPITAAATDTFVLSSAAVDVPEVGTMTVTDVSPGDVVLTGDREPDTVQFVTLKAEHVALICVRSEFRHKYGTVLNFTRSTKGDKRYVYAPTG